MMANILSGEYVDKSFAMPYSSLHEQKASSGHHSNGKQRKINTKTKTHK
jgi:hypothetical protein